MTAPVAEPRLEPHPLTDTERVALDGMQEAHDTKQFPHVATLGDAWVEAKGQMPAVAATLYAEGLMAAGRVEEAVLWSGRAVNALPKVFAVPRIAALTTYGRALARAGDFNRSRLALINATRILTDHDETLEKQGHILCAVSDRWRKGWALQEHRLSEPSKALPENLVQWDGKAQGPVAVLHEQGIGDAVLFARWLPLIAKVSGHPVTWYGPELMREWMCRIPGVTVGNIADLAASEGQLAMRAMSAPHLLRCNSKYDVPPPAAPESLVEARSLRKRGPELTVGVCWKGSAQGWHDFERSYTADEFAPVWADLPDVRFVNLCHDADVPSGAPFERRMFADVYDTGRTVLDCDFVVTVDTATLHIAGSLGVPTICIVPTVADWRFAWPRGISTPFYPSVTVLRRRNIRDNLMVSHARRLLEELCERVRSR